MDEISIKKEINRSFELCRRVVTSESLIEEAKAIYGNRYDYSKVKYVNGQHKIIVGCRIHGDFEVFAREHLDGKGCPKCAKGESFIKKVKEKFGDKFLFDHFIYNDSLTPVELICQEHGSFSNTPTAILTSHYGCPECSKERIKIMQEEVKKEARIRKEEKQREEYELTVFEATKSAIDNPHAYISSNEIGNFWMLERLFQKLDNRSIKKLIRALEFEIQNRPSNAGKSRACVNYDNIKTSNSFVAIDFETLYAQHVSACSVGMVKFVKGEIVDKYYTLIRPPFDYSGKKGSALTWVHGITEDMLFNERTFDEILPEMELFADGLPLVAHNCCVERACIREASAFYHTHSTLDIEHFMDTYPTALIVENKLGIEECGSGTHSLDAVCKRFGIEVKCHHNALDDAEMCGRLMVRFHEILTEGTEINISKSKEALFHDLFIEGKEVINSKSQETPIKDISSLKFNPEDKIQRGDLENIACNPFKNMVVVLTGFEKSDSQQIGHQLHELGAIIKESVSRKTDILITGHNAGPSKLKKAEEYNVKIMPESEVLEILKSL